MSSLVHGAQDGLDGLLGELAGGAFVLTDGHGAVSKWSEPADLLFGRSAPDVLGRSFFDTLIAAPLGPAGERWRRFLATGDAPCVRGTVELHARHADGHGFEVELVLVPVRLEEGFGFAQFLEDLHLELEPAQRLARLRARHPVVVRALHAALSPQPLRWDPAWRAAGTLVVFRPLGEAPWVQAERERRAQGETALAAAGGPIVDLRALLVDVQSRIDALAARFEGFEAGFAEARKAGTAGREAEPAREATPARSQRPRRAGFDDAAAPMALLDLRGHVHAINAAFSALVGYREDEFTKAVWPSAHDRGDYREQCDQLRRMAAGELESVGVRSTYMHGTGLLVPVRGELTLVRDAEGRPEHLRLSAQERSSH